MIWWLRSRPIAVLVRHHRFADHTFSHGSLPGISVTILQLHKTLARAVCLIRIHWIGACFLSYGTDLVIVDNVSVTISPMTCLLRLLLSWCWTKAKTVSGLWAGVSSSNFWTALDIKKGNGNSTSIIQTIQQSKDIQRIWNSCLTIP